MRAWSSVVLFAIVGGLIAATFAIPLQKPNCSKSREELHPESTVVGGEPIRIEERPYQVLIKNRMRAGGGYSICGGTIYNQEYILSAAHCFWIGVREATLDELEVYVGKTHLFQTDPEEIKLGVAKVISHPGYSYDGNFKDDIALLRLSSCLKYNVYIQPLGLVKAPVVARGMVPATISGWGKTGKEYLNSPESGAAAPQLQVASIHFIPRDRCIHDFENFDPSKLHVEGTDPSRFDRRRATTIPSTSVCGTADGIDTCGGDSGGPLVCEVPGEEPGLCGIVSFGLGCALGIPGVYTDVFHFQEWILQNTPTMGRCS